jgi:hypothetical protein
MKPTTKIRFTEPQIALVMRAHPGCNLDHSELSFEFDQAGKIAMIFTLQAPGLVGSTEPRAASSNGRISPLYPARQRMQSLPRGIGKAPRPSGLPGAGFRTRWLIPKGRSWSARKRLSLNTA